MNTHLVKLRMSIEKKELITSKIAFHAIKVRTKRIYGMGLTTKKKMRTTEKMTMMMIDHNYNKKPRP